MIRYDLDARLLPATDELLDGPVIVRVGTFDDKGVGVFRRQMQRAIDAAQTVIPVLIDSDGGSTWAEMAILDELDAARATGARIATVACGRAQSAAADVLAAGDRGLRFASPMATVMVHDMGDSPPPAKIEELRASYQEARREHELLMDRFEDHCGKARGYFRKIIHQRHHNADWWMDAREARRHGIVDHVGMPELTVSVSVRFKLALPKRKAVRS